MADVNTGTGTEDGASRVPLPPQQSEPEATIIEETVIRPAPPAAAPTGKTPEPPVPTPAPLPPPSPQTASAIPEIPRAPETAQKEHEAIARILKEIKLPERREAPASRPAEAQAPKAFDTTLNAAIPEKKEPVAQPPVAPADTQASPGDGLASSIVSPLRTLKNDLQAIVKDKKISLVRAVALEQEKRQGRDSALRSNFRPQAQSGRTFRILFASGLLIILGGAALFGVSVIMQERSSSPPPEQGTSLLFAESSISTPLQNNIPSDLKRLLAAGRTAGTAALGSITRIVPIVPEAGAAPEMANLTRPATTAEFLEALGTRASPDLMRALGDDFFFGFHTVDKNAPLLVIPVVSYERAFAGMLAWEDTANADLAPVFMAIPDQTTGAGGLPEKRRFEDIVMRNYDVRALKDDAGNIGLYYSFPTQDILVIAESPYSFAEILSRLRAGRHL